MYINDLYRELPRFRRRRIDKAFGRIPKGQDSPFGDFPEEYDRRGASSE